ncbi:MAG TPA: hypothetical protein VJ242_04115 [Patescibacteria group bacterium]|nr:hypothetical protein [Patescibacteria group bacterium]
MSLKILWRSTVFVVTLLLIYLAFPILIVPSSLPAIQQIIIEGLKPETELTYAPDYFGVNEGVPIQQVTLPIPLTLSERFEELKNLHRKGMDLILNR